MDEQSPKELVRQIVADSSPTHLSLLGYVWEIAYRPSKENRAAYGTRN